MNGWALVVGWSIFLYLSTTRLNVCVRVVVSNRLIIVRFGLNNAKFRPSVRLSTQYAVFSFIKYRSIACNKQFNGKQFLSSIFKFYSFYHFHFNLIILEVLLGYFDVKGLGKWNKTKTFVCRIIPIVSWNTKGPLNSNKKKLNF